MTAAAADKTLRVVPLGPDSVGSTACKFIVLQNAAETVLVFGPVSAYRYHAALVNSFCEREEVPAGWIKKPDQVEIYDDQWEVRGGGWLELDKNAATVEFYGYSTAYGKYRIDDVQRFLTGHPFFSGLAVIGLQ